MDQRLPAGLLGLSGLDCGVALRSMPGESECGDAWAAQPTPDGVVLVVVDGLGHGEAAAEAAQRVVSLIARHSCPADLTDVFRDAHSALLGSRGAALSVAHIDAVRGLLTWEGVGNVEAIAGRVARGLDGAASYESLVTRGGVVGYHLPALRPATVRFEQGSVLALATDGIRHGFACELRPDERAQSAADRILDGYARPDDDALVLIARSVSHG